MWQVTGKTVDPRLFKPHEPVEVLYDFEGPRTFTHRDSEGQLCLAHWCDADRDVDRFIVVPFMDALVQKLKAGEITLRDALDQPRTWVVDLAHSGDVRAAWSVQLSDLPPDVLPKAGTMLWPSLEPLISLRALGEAIQEGQVPGSVILGLVEGVRRALKLLAEYVLDQPAHAGRPSKLLQRLFDLPAQRLAFGSFEIAFRSPIRAPDLFKDVSREEMEEEQKALREVGHMLQTGLRWLATGDVMKTVADDVAVPEEKRIILQAIKNLIPSSQGVIHEVELRGELVGSRSRPAVLDRSNRKLVNQTLALILPPAQPARVLEMTGRVRELDKDRLTFELRDIEGDQKPDRQVFSFEPEFLEDVMEAFNEDTRVRIVAVEDPNRKYWVVVIAKGPPL